ncbi:MAG: EamA family transporter [Clostridia bacterium]|nr:EamA family transporter [Clostridia bacterium]
MIYKLSPIMRMVLASVLWSLGGLLIKMIDWNPLAIAGGRSAIAAIVMMFYIGRPTVKMTKNKFYGALAYTGTLVCFVSANKLTTSANAILLQYSAPIWVALFSTWFLKEKITKLDWITIAAVMGGMVLFFMENINGGYVFGNIIAIISGVFFAAMLIFLKLEGNGSPVEITLLGNVFVFLVSIPFLFNIVVTPKAILTLLALGIFQIGFAYILYASATPYVSSVEAILIPVIEPLLNPVWVMLFIGEVPGLLALIGGIIIVSAIVIRSLIESKQEKTLKKTTAVKAAQ